MGLESISWDEDVGRCFLILLDEEPVVTWVLFVHQLLLEINRSRISNVKGVVANSIVGAWDQY